MLQRKQTKIFDTEYLSISAVAQVLGVSERTAHSLIHDTADPIPHFRIRNKLVRVRKSDLHAWMDRRRVEAAKVDRLLDEIFGRGSHFNVLKPHTK